ncbi:c6 transcription factor [Neofusicoccum parvum]|nr:c6 transcription factor [Neofusicoccum parvum]
MPKGVRKWRLHHFMFDFRGHQGPLRDPLAEVHIRKEIGDAFIAEYFKTIHPQLPVLVQSEIEETWAKFWDTPAIDPKPLKGKELVLIVLALGARVSCVNGKYEASQLENWAAYFAERTELSSTFMLSPNLKATHFMLLKAMYSLQLMKQNDAYLYLGYAARSALSLGIHKSEVVQALTYATFFPSRAEAQRTAGNLFDIQTSIAVSVTCAKSIIHIASELCSRRNPDMKQDGGVSFYLLIACITLLFDVLDPATTPEYAKATFEAVESGIQVLDTMQHIGPNNSKELSLDIMKFAKDAVLSGGEDIDLERDLTGSFPWLR